MDFRDRAVVVLRFNRAYRQRRCSMHEIVFRVKTGKTLSAAKQNGIMAKLVYNITLHRQPNTQYSSQYYDLVIILYQLMQFYLHM